MERTVRLKINFDEELKELRIGTEEKYKSILSAQQNVLDATSASLTMRLAKLAHASASVRIQWDEDASRYVKVDPPLARASAKESEFEGELARFGHGFQRSYLLALLQELAGCPDSGDPKLILACEEPELHQHPSQARHLATALELISQQNSQVVVCSHSPYFICGPTFEDVRLVRYDGHSGTSIVREVRLDEVAKLIGESFGDEPVSTSVLAIKIEQILQERLKELFFSPILILVEGLEDVGYVESYFSLMEMKDMLRVHGCNVVPTSGKDKMVRPLAIAKVLEIPTFIIFDADAEAKDNVGQNEKLNVAIMKLCGIHEPDPFPKKTLRGKNLYVWPNNIGDIVRQDIGSEVFDAVASQIAAGKGVGRKSLEKDHLFISQVLCETWESGKKSSTLQDLCKSIMAFAIRERSAAEGTLSGNSAAQEGIGS